MARKVIGQRSALGGSVEEVAITMVEVAITMAEVALKVDLVLPCSRALLCQPSQQAQIDVTIVMNLGTGPRIVQKVDSNKTEGEQGVTTVERRAIGHLSAQSQDEIYSQDRITTKISDQRLRGAMDRAHRCRETDLNY